MGGRQRVALVTGAVLGLVAIGGWTTALTERHRHARVVADLQARLNHGTVVDDVTGLLNRAGTNLLATRIVNISRRDSDAVCGALIRILPPPGRPRIDDEDAITVAEAAQVTFRAGDAVGRVAYDTIMVVGKGPGFKPATVEARLAAQMLAMAPDSGAARPGIVVGVGVLQPWDEGALPELEHRLQSDLQVRLEVAGLLPPGGAT